MTLQEAIDFAINPPPGYAQTEGIDVYVTISMHNDAGGVLVGDARGARYTSPKMFRPDLALLNLGGTATIGGGGSGSWLRRGPVPGFSTRGGAGSASLRVPPPLGFLGPLPIPSIPIDFSVRRDPGFPRLSFLGFGPSVQIEIETLSAPGGTATGGIKLEMAEDGQLLRAVGPDLQDPTQRASYTATILVMPIIP
jgi:hypothetical protein